MKAIVNSNSKLSETFPVEHGVKQEDILAQTLYTSTAVVITTFKDNTNGIYIVYMITGKLFNIRRLPVNTKLLVALVRHLLYADECHLVGNTEQDLVSRVKYVGWK